MPTAAPSPLRYFPRLAALLLLAGCAAHEPAADAPERGFTILAINDVYRIEGADGGLAGGLARVRSLRARLERESPDLLLLHAGDMLFPSLPSRLYGGGQMIDVLNLLDGDGEAFDERMFATFGNHEFDQDGLDDVPMLQRRIEDSQFTWLDSNVEWTAGPGGAPALAAENLTRTKLFDLGGVAVGLFSLTTDFKKPAYVTRFGDPAEVARELTARLRDEGAEVVVALTHLALGEDVAFVSRLGAEGPDLVVGGHDHDRHHEEVGGRWILKADAEARSATEVRVSPRRDGPPAVSFRFHELDAEADADPAVGRRVVEWLDRFDREYCASVERPPGCLGDVVGHTRVELVAEELEIRRIETNFGNWVADQALRAAAGEGARIAFVNAGGLRLNQNVPAGDVLREHVEETFQYPSGLALVRLTGGVLREVVDRAVEDWTGSGHWLQVSGFAFRHDPDAGTASNLTLLDAGGPRAVAADEEILAVTVEFLADPATGQDGYTMITRNMRVETSVPLPPLKELVLRALEEAGEDGIAPEVEGRICNSRRPGPCLACEDGLALDPGDGTSPWSDR
jgi:2',3'-cyclic-nucleotide 2'-phosphodiesterase (5'-nucleotidase family)